MWFIYILRCDKKWLYTGITTDPDRRYREHAAGKSKSAKFTRRAKVLELLYTIPVGDRSLATKAEYRIKRLPKSKKLSIIKHNFSREALLEFLGLA